MVLGQKACSDAVFGSEKVRNAASAAGERESVSIGRGLQTVPSTPRAFAGCTRIVSCEAFVLRFFRARRATWLGWRVCDGVCVHTHFGKPPEMSLKTLTHLYV